jgi:PAS domain S-box-containing protein
MPMGGGLGSSVPSSSTFKQHELIQWSLRVRRDRVAAYGLAVAVVAAASLLRWSVGGQVMAGLPFITFYPAIVIAALLGGFWPGILATLLSAAAAWFFFMAPVFSFHFDKLVGLSLLLFIFVAGINVVLVGLLNATVERIIDQGQNVRVLIESAPSGIVVVDEQGTITLVNSSIEQQFGYDRFELVGKKIETLVPVALVEAHAATREAFLEKPEARAMGAGRDLRGRRKDGSEFPVEVGLNPVGQNGRTAVLATVIDISERKRAQDRQQFLMRELHHRSQNLFAVIQAIAARSLAEGKTLAEAKGVFDGRLSALARTHAMLAESAWEGAPLADIVYKELVGFSKHLSISGCDIIVNTPAAQQFALIVHELATNAVKYGALSSLEGHVSIECAVERLDGGGTFSFRWKESGGPQVIAPSRKGFGSVILLDAARKFAQNVVLNYDSHGFTYELQLSLSAIEGPEKQGERAQMVVQQL